MSGNNPHCQHRSNRCLRKAQQGLSLVELMISLLLGLLLLEGVLTIVVDSQRSYGENDRIAALQDEARFALNELARDIASAGFLAELVDPSDVTPDTSLTIVDDCGAGWAYDVSVPLQTLDNATGAVASAAFGCIEGTVYRAGTDLLAIKRTSGSEAPALENDTVYLKTNGINGLLLRHPEAAPPAAAIAAPVTHWNYAPVLYYIRTHADDNNVADGLPTLCRKYLDTSGPPTVAEECIARGIEDLQFEFGIDADGDSVIEQYVAQPTVAQRRRIAAVRIFLLARTLNGDLLYTNDKTYRISNSPDYTPQDLFNRRVFSTTVLTRNLSYRNEFGS